MTKMTAQEMRKVEGGYTVYCPVCNKKSKTFWLRDLFMGKKASIAYEEAWLSAKHYSWRTGYNGSKSVH